MSSSVLALDEKRHVGQVKWFNNKAGYGFITFKHDSGDIDIFTHYSTVTVNDTQYKYLVQGEYVEFALTKSTNDKYTYQATNITGIGGGKLMCETRQISRQTYRAPVEIIQPEPVCVEEDEYTRVVKKKRSNPKKMNV